MAIASDSCASAEIEPNDIAPVQNRLTISLAGCTWSIGMGPPLTPDFVSSRSVRDDVCRATLDRAPVRGILHG